MFKKFYLFILLLMSASAFAQWRVEGTVVDELSKKPLEGVKVHVNASAWQVTPMEKENMPSLFPKANTLSSIHLMVIPVKSN